MRAGGDRDRTLALAALIVAVFAPVVVVLSAFAVRLGVMPVEPAIDVMTLGVARIGAFVAPVVALIALFLTRSSWRRTAKYSVAALIVSGVTLGLFLHQTRQMAVATPLDVTTNPAEPPTLRLQAGTPQTCPGLAPVETQLLPEGATWALQQQGFTITDAGMFEVRGTRQGFWFGRRYDAVVRIRPGRTDFRLAAQGQRPDGGAVCRQALALAGSLQPAT